MSHAALLFSVLPVLTVPPPPPTLSIFDGQRAPSRQMLAWNPGEVRCGGEVIGGAALRPAAEIAFVDPQRVKAVSYRFGIDAAGRTHSIARDAGELSPVGQDIGPALAASRFAAGVKRESCQIEYVPKFNTLANAPIADLIAYSILPTGPKLPKEGWDRIGTAGNCREKPRPAPLLSGHPDFLKLKATPGARDWTLVGYDTDADGRPSDVRIVRGTGNDELDAAAIEAIRASRFTGGARTGCLYPYWRSAGRPASGARDARRRADAPGECRLSGEGRMGDPAHHLLSASLSQSRDRGMGGRFVRHRAVGRGRQCETTRSTAVSRFRQPSDGHRARCPRHPLGAGRVGVRRDGEIHDAGGRCRGR